MSKPWPNAPGPKVIRSRDKLEKALIVSFRCLHLESVDSCLTLGLKKANLRSVRLEHPANSYHKPSYWCLRKEISIYRILVKMMWPS